jgi:P pilus assembly chaperone PapD
MLTSKTSSRAASWTRVGLALTGFVCAGTLAAHAQLAPELAPAGDAAGKSFDVAPIAIIIAKGQTSGSVIVTSNGGTENHFSVAGFHWKQDEKGKMALDPADELVFFPQSFTLSGGKTERIRVGAEGVDPSTEQTYRLVVYQLPPKVSPGAGKRPALGVGVGLRISVPIFVEPQNPKETAEVDLSPLQASKLGVDVAATGNVHVAPSIVHVVATDAGGKKVLDTKSSVWYTLAGTKTHVDVPILQAQCNAITHVNLDLQDSLGHSLTTRDVSDPQKSCT